MGMKGGRVIAGLIAGEDVSAKVITDFFNRRKNPNEIASSFSSSLLGQNRLKLGAAQMVNSVYFKSAIHISIILTSILLGIQSDIEDNGPQPLLDALEYIFTTIFCIEMLLKVFVMRRVYFTHPWCVMDFVIAWISIADTLLSRTKAFREHNFHVVKAFRLMRLFRVLKVLKVVPELRMVVEGLAASLRALSWVTFLLFVVLYAFAIFCVEIVGKAETVYPGFDKTVAIQNFNNYEYFGSISRAILSLISITFLAEWNVIRPLWESQWPVTLVLMIFIFITSFGIVNVIIGVIVERITVSMQQTQIEEAERQKRSTMFKFETVADELFGETKEADWGEEELPFAREVSRQDMRHIAGRADILDLLQHVDFPAGFTFDDLFTMLNVDGVGDVRKQEFLTGMQRLVFSNKFQRTCISHLSLGQVKELIQMFWSDQEQQLGHIRRELSELRSCTTQVLAAVKAQADSHTPKESVGATSAVQAQSKKRPPALSDSALGFLVAGKTESWASPPPSPMKTQRQWEGRHHTISLQSTKHADSQKTMLPRVSGKSGKSSEPESENSGVMPITMLPSEKPSDRSLGSGHRDPQSRGTAAVHVAETFVQPVRYLGEAPISVRTEASGENNFLLVVPGADCVPQESRANEARESSNFTLKAGSKHQSSGVFLVPVEEVDTPYQSGKSTRAPHAEFETHVQL